MDGLGLLGVPRSAEDRTGDLLAKVGRSIAHELSQPQRRAFWGAYLVTVAVCARKRVPFLAAFVMGELAGHAAAKAWQIAEDVHAIAENAREADDVDD
jgi:hypothetical protein